MEGLVFTGDRRVTVQQFADPVAGPGEVVVAMRASGICGSDPNLYRKSSQDMARKPVVCGHEPCGVVVERGPGVSPEQALVGLRVMIHHYRGCEKCWPCRMGYTQMCEQADIMGTDSDGGHAAFLLAPAYSLVPLPDELSFAEGAAISCGTGTAYAALKRLAVSGRDTLAIFGQGPVGLAATQLAMAMGARVVSDRPIRGTVDAGAGDGRRVDRGPQRCRCRVGYSRADAGEGADATLDCSGNSGARANCAKAAKAWGRAGFVGAHGTATFDMTPDVIHSS